jgi:hypothetical protein
MANVVVHILKQSGIPRDLNGLLPPFKIRGRKEIHAFSGWKVADAGKAVRLRVLEGERMLGDMVDTGEENNSNETPVTQTELIESVLEPLSSLIDSVRLEILKKIQRVEDSVEILARQMRRELDE